LAEQHHEITAAGARVFGISVDSPEQHAALIDKLQIPFPLLSDPDRAEAIGPYGLANEKDPRNLALPTVVIIAPDGNEALRIVSRDYADRTPEAHVLAQVQALDLPPTTQEQPELGPAESGPKAMALSSLLPYYQGAKFATKAMGMRFPVSQPEAEQYMAQLDRYSEGVKRVYRAKRDAG
jgi:alkyl hydroperoxide reductase subunit AhpC